MVEGAVSRIFCLLQTTGSEFYSFRWCPCEGIPELSVVSVIEEASREVWCHLGKIVLHLGPTPVQQPITIFLEDLCLISPTSP